MILCCELGYGSSRLFQVSGVGYSRSHVRPLHADLRVGSADLLLGLSGAPLNLQPRYNVVPAQEAAVVRADREGLRRLLMLRLAPAA